MGAGPSVIDTDVISELTKPSPDAAVLAWLAAQPRFLLSAVTVYELVRGISLLRAGRKRQFLEEWLAELLNGPSEVLGFGEECALLAVQIETAARRQGRCVDARDLFILATALAHGHSLATRNVAHFRGLGVTIINPFGR